MTYVVTMSQEARAERRAAIAALLKAGKPPDEIAAQFGVSLATVRSCGAVKPKGRGVSGRTFEIIAAIINTNQSFTKMAVKFGVSRAWISAVSLRLRDVGIKYPDRVQGPPGDQE